MRCSSSDHPTWPGGGRGAEKSPPSPPFQSLPSPPLPPHEQQQGAKAQLEAPIDSRPPCAAAGLEPACGPLPLLASSRLPYAARLLLRAADASALRSARTRDVVAPCHACIRAMLMRVMRSHAPRCFAPHPSPATHDARCTQYGKVSTSVRLAPTS